MQIEGVPDFVAAIQQVVQQAAAGKVVQQVQHPHSPFVLLHVPAQGLYLHLVALQPYSGWYNSGACTPTFFAQLSAHYATQGQQVMHVWEDVWRATPHKVEQRIATLLGQFVRYHARKGQVQRLSKPLLIQFLEQHHLQAPLPGKYRYGLYIQGELLAVVAFSPRRPIERGGVIYQSYELLRFVNKQGCVVAGGLGKLLQHFIREQHPDDVMSYVDADWGTGRAFEQLGFVRTCTTEPLAFWVDSRHYHRVLAVPGTVLPAAEAQTMLPYPVYNSASYKYILLLR